MLKRTRQYLVGMEQELHRVANRLEQDERALTSACALLHQAAIRLPKNDPEAQLFRKEIEKWLRRYCLGQAKDDTHESNANLTTT